MCNLTRRNTQSGAMGFLVMGSQDQRSNETVHDVEFTDTRRETVEKENRKLEKNIQKSG